LSAASISVPPLAAEARGGRQVSAERVAVVYTAGASGREGYEAARLKQFGTGQGWRLLDAHFDPDDSAHPSKRPGLGLALEQLRFGVANALVVDEGVYASMPDCLWLKIAVQHAGGALCLMPDGRKPIAAFLELLRPRGCVRRARDERTDRDGGGDADRAPRRAAGAAGTYRLCPGWKVARDTARMYLDSWAVDAEVAYAVLQVIAELLAMWCGTPTARSRW